ncbi:DinB family protein (plasmid) [Gordonia rubripertincta]|uniref:DinB family protein n=1 Tax=Gordonia rubripertincta TaxID=36822 RepID=A0AAW6RAP6_GORRU|nr:DinB family protein [Gordonia rubripertincta]MCZ4537516.1 DinB family protein [Gordonia terrae]MDG6782993.1 DinB family protein [Gordonia rubripertincta]
MDEEAAKKSLHRYLRESRSALVWKLDGLSDYNVRRPLTPHGTNLLGLVKHLSGCEIGYFGAVFGRPFPHNPPWLTSTTPNVDMWAAPDESRASIIDLYQRACAHSDHTIAKLPLDATGEVPLWTPQDRVVTLHQILVHMIAETSRHAGHADIVREIIDETTGRTPDEASQSPVADPTYWSRLHEQIEDAARSARHPTT